MPGVQPVHRTVFGARTGPPGADRRGKTRPDRADRAYGGPPRGSAGALLQRAPLQAPGSWPAAAFAFRRAARFADEYRDKISAPRGRGCVPATGQLEKSKERTTPD